MILKGYFFGIGYALICLVLSFILYKFGMPKKYTRKVVHILVGFEWVILYTLMGAGVHFLSVCLIFLALLFIAYKGKMMPMISSDEDNAPGTVYYAVAMTGVALVGCFVPKVMLPFGIGVLCTSVGDGFAGVIGQLIKNKNPRIYGNKTLFGTLTNFLTSSLGAFVISYVFSAEIGIVYCLAIGLLSAELELITPYGLDNISITWGISALSYSFMYFGGIDEYLIPILLSPLIIIFAKGKKALTNGGVVFAILLDIVVTWAFGTFGFVILCAFFIGAVIIDKIKKRVKNKGRNNHEDEEDCRNYMQVLANGTVAFLSALAFIITSNKIFVVTFVTSLAEAFSDTAASGIGVFASKTYDPFKWRVCEKGLSGGMSLEGTFASLCGACLIAFAAYLFGFAGYGIKEFFIVAICAFLGAVFDSFMGSVFQVKYKCPSCGSITESTEHCNMPTEKYSGFIAIDNDIVNIVSCTFSALLSAVFMLL